MLVSAILRCFVYTASTVLVSGFVVRAQPTTHRLSTRNITSDLKTIKRGIPAKNGKLRSCEVGLYHSKAALVSTDCIDFSNGQVNIFTKYDVYVDDGIDGKPDKYKVERITVHPEFDPTTKANNLAVLQFNLNQNITWHNTVAIRRKLYWSDMVYSRRLLKDLDSMTWDDLVVSANPQSEDPKCDIWSTLQRQFI
ncbi:hypothetical protein EDC05_000019 [Coemansia umbellata]|uniref:Peptidase S1 domain-containing protein n=1 Tax=Coemansia umbellata TaxID=1424467 RepID=A0ABQ8PVR9_9FUNG|nr:hypothetical protein EDC05_000019 [Coemansia umbellata]